ncbi:MAG: rod shape-determining protein RodA [Lachnospiraceae bacterium]|jgi:rod shape determining protein RodA|nr:rod shape-determining protein RodA [Lachnospiraceae bacterium]NBJ81187.1 rod shape-determining protein RodA [bacterium 1XD42-76]NBK04630.1 rod shape-determining protein RodA [bacterium 1XD42-94]
MISEYNFRNFNFRLLFCVIALNVIGVLVINSAVNGDLNYTRRQLIGLFGGLLMALIFCLINYHYIMKLSWIVYLGCIGILAAVMLTGQLGGTGGGSRRWITLPVLGRLQPSEFVKIGLILFFSWYLQKNQEKINRFSTLVVLALLAAIPLLLIVEQPDLSTSIVIAFFILCLVFIAGISYKWIFGSVAVMIPLLAVVLYLAQLDLVPFIKGYQVNRILAFVNPEKYAELNLQQDNSEMAIGSGMLYGKGLFNDTAISVKNGNFLSEEHTDFIFSVIGEELGFVGCMIVLILFLLFIYECLRMAGKAGDLSGRLLCTGMAALVGFQAFTNIAVATGIFPNTGLPLPFVSYGVSSLVSLYIGIGIILNVGLQQTKQEV